MSRSAKVELPFDQPREFRLGIGQLEELQERCDAGPEELFHRLQGHRWRVADIQQTLRLGLIGAGMPATEAAVLISRYASEGQLLEWKDHARAILYASMAGAPDEDDAPEKPKRRRKTRSPAASSGSDDSTSGAESSGSPRPK